jgi:hypothetical protein
MHRLAAAGVLVVAVSGCAAGPSPVGLTGSPMPVFYDNPILVPVSDHQQVWETVVDVMDDYFRIEREEPVRRIGDTLTEGRLDTFPAVGATIFEPWLHDSADHRERVESTLQSIRRRAVVRVTADQGGYWIDVAVFKELEDVAQPEHATAGAATFRYDDSLTRVVNPAHGQETNDGWIPQGRDTALEQRILGHLQSRFGGLGVRMLPPGQVTW